MFKISIRNFVIGLLFSLITVTIISLMLSQFTEIDALKTGPAFLIVFAGVFISVLFWAGYDKRIEKSEIFTLLFVALVLTGIFFAMKSYIPEIFSVLPDSTKELFSSAFPDSIKQTFSSWRI